MFDNSLITNTIENTELLKQTLLDKFPMGFSILFSAIILASLRFLSWSESALSDLEYKQNIKDVF